MRGVRSCYTLSVNSTPGVKSNVKTYCPWEKSQMHFFFFFENVAVKCGQCNTCAKLFTISSASSIFVFSSSSSSGSRKSTEQQSVTGFVTSGRDLINHGNQCNPMGQTINSLFWFEKAGHFRSQFWLCCARFESQTIANFVFALVTEFP